MNGTAAWRLAWKEYRQMRGIAVAFWIVAVLALMMTAQFLDGGNWMAEMELQASGWFYLFCALCGAMLFAAEKENATFGHLQKLPLNWGTLLSGKLLAGLVVIAAVPLLYWLIIVAVASQFRGPIFVSPTIRLPEEFTHHIMVVVSGATHFFAFGLLFSLICRRVLIAAVLGVVAAVTIDTLIVQRFGPENPDYFSITAYEHSIPFRLFTAVLILVISVPLTRVWWRGVSAEAWRQGIAWTQSRQREASSRDQATPHGFMFWHLLWQSVHGNYWKMLAIGGVVLVPATIFAIWESRDPMFDAPDGSLWLWFAIAFAAWLAGVFCFQADQRQHSFRFFVQHREYPRWVWLTRNLFWLAGWLLASAVGLAISRSILLSVFEGGFHHTMLPASSPEMAGVAQQYLTFMLCGGLVIFAAGQLASMLFRSSIVAGFAAAVAVVPLLFWTSLMMTIMAPWWWTVLTIAVVLLACSWWWAPRWMAERPVYVGHVASVGAVSITLAILVVGVNEHRRHYVPPHPITWGWHADNVQLIEQSRDKYAAALAALDQTDAPDSRWIFELERLHRTISEPTTDALIDWVQQNTLAISLLHGAARFVADRWDEFSKFAPWHPVQMRSPLLANTEQVPHRAAPFDVFLIRGGPQHLLFAEAEMAMVFGEIDRAWAAIATRLWIGAQRANLFPFDWYYRGFWHAHGIPYRQVDRWANLDGHSEQGLMQAISVLASLPDQPADRLYRRLYYDHQDSIDDMQRRSLGSWQNRLLWNLFPAERTNALNFVDQLTATELQAIDILRYGDPFALSTMPYRNTWASDERIRQLARWEVTTANSERHGYAWNTGISMERTLKMAEHLLRSQRFKQALIVKLGLVAYRLRHGDYPDSLSELVDDGIFEQLPVDPVTGEQFAYSPRGLDKPTFERAGHANWYVRVADAKQPLLFAAPHFGLVEKEILEIDGWIDTKDENFNPNEFDPQSTSGLVATGHDPWFVEVSTMILLMPELEDEK